MKIKTEQLRRIIRESTRKRTVIVDRVMLQKLIKEAIGDIKLSNKEPWIVEVLTQDGTWEIHGTFPTYPEAKDAADTADDLYGSGDGDCARVRPAKGVSTRSFN